MEAKVKLTLTDEMLGTKPAEAAVCSEWVNSKAQDPRKQTIEDEIAKFSEDKDKIGMTIFHRDEKGPFIHAYQVKGFLKEACGALRQADDSLSKKVTAYKSKIDLLIFIGPDRIYLNLGGEPVKNLTICERPLRAETAQGPRVALARSEATPAGTQLEFTIVSLAKKFGKGEDAISVKDLIDEWLAYGRFRGLGQWRNSGKGRADSTIDWNV